MTRLSMMRVCGRGLASADTAPGREDANAQTGWMIDCQGKTVLITGAALNADGGSLAAAGRYRDPKGTWTNVPVIVGNGTNL